MQRDRDRLSLLLGSTVPVMRAVEPPHVAAATSVEEGGGLVGHEAPKRPCGDRGRAVGPDLQDLDHERVAGSAPDRDRPHLTRPLATGLLVPVAPDTLAHEDVTGTDGEDGRAHRERRVADSRLEAMRLRARGRGRRDEEEHGGRGRGAQTARAESEADSHHDELDERRLGARLRLQERDARDAEQRFREGPDEDRVPGPAIAAAIGAGRDERREDPEPAL